MDPLAQEAWHPFYIWSSYAAVALVVAVLMTWVILDGRRLARELARLEAQGVRRRSSSPAGRAKTTP